MIELSKIFSTFFYLGYIKWVPGTFGSLAALIITLLIIDFFSLFFHIFLFSIIFILSIIFIHIYSKSISRNDSKEIIIDEFLGIYLIMLFYENFNSINFFIKILLIFFLFRFFDILKPFPANWIDKNYKNSFGVILDDLIAGVFTLFTLFLINAFI
ncbi:MAG: Phosphatidylglycerophosphatase A [Alphaproteobacteria bacterium MarineAlpha5_Bin6]|nr:MAG: Phosphatidylglycerophosphatase A [Alphaproteobacteria bacterium MarineAlpha5_Bin7]PPR53661.1 MAG: Phosphatidylglycerophosphatase A [Alphaproteobacteria bacterium MarineAlpha5_Bin6]|tara:strand:- start:2112 stop:2579 length:468 start_codon:yes stop_codon:yes gene_type:complete